MNSTRREQNQERDEAIEHGRRRHHQQDGAEDAADEARARSARRSTSADRAGRGDSPTAPPSDPGQIATVLVALAIVDGSPTQMSAGNDTSVPPPATELMAPATNAATKTTRYDMHS